MTDRTRLEAEVRRLDAEWRRLTGPGVKLSGPRLLERTREYAERYQKTEPAREAVRYQADRLVPELLDLYTVGSDGDRDSVRRLLRECPTFRWGFGWNFTGPKPPMSSDQALIALALLSMKDAGKDSRDQRVWLQSLCSAMKQSELDVPLLLRRAAEWSSDTPQYPPAPSTRALLLQYAERFALRDEPSPPPGEKAG